MFLDCHLAHLPLPFSFVVCVCVLHHALCFCSVAARSAVAVKQSGVAAYVPGVSCPPLSVFSPPGRAGQLIASLVIGGLGRGHGCHLARGAANMAGFLFHLPLKLNHFCAKIDCGAICIASLTAARVNAVVGSVRLYCAINQRTTQ